MWNALKTVRNTWHVLNSETLEHFEVDTEQQIHDVLDGLAMDKQEKAAAAEEAARQAETVTVPQSEQVVGVTGRAN